MKMVTRTIYGGALQATQFTGTAFKQVANTTLNEKFGIQANSLVPAGTIPTMGIVVIGNGGHKLSVGANNIAKPDPVQHKSTDAGLYNHIPFVLRELDNDLTQAQMAGYRLRQGLQINGVNYIAYYGKKLDYTGIQAQMEYMTVAPDGTITITPFVPTSANLNPTPPDLSPSGVNVTTGDYTIASIKVPFNLSSTDAAELVNVANLMYGDPDLAIISEIGLCSGVDKLVAGGGSGQPTFNYTESIGTQICSIFNSFYPMNYADNGINVMLDVGSTEPLLKLAGVNS